MTKQLCAETLLEDQAGQWSATRRIVEAVLAEWFNHVRYAAKGLAARDADMMRTTETLAEATLVLAGANLVEIVRYYRWTCDQLREEEFFFYREGRYRLSTFTEADAEVYSDVAYMEKYMDGLLISQVLWSNHAASCHFFLTETPPLLQPGGRHLEIGLGHGLMMSLALSDFGLTAATAWDVSEVSLEQTHAALAKLGHDSCHFAVQNVMDVIAGAEPYDLVVLPVVLEHLEDPKSVAAPLHSLVWPDAKFIFSNVPINSPSPDHLNLMQTPDDARALLTDTWFEIVREGFYDIQGTAPERALRNWISVCGSMLSKPV